ncbi:MAG: hypothetical protein K1W09_01955 [Akkermansia muciniphila]|uniref:hypothetical protein n=1 Tax=uncultured Akkermansia sp. TaxID=512294 RepID=UPI00261E38C7|nr:hypothetical protein [uncultured Akkermansia sp.]
MGSEDRTFTSFCNRFTQNDSFPSIREQNIPSRVPPAIPAEFFIQLPHLMVECIEWSHEYMAADNKPSYIDDAWMENISIMIDKIIQLTYFINRKEKK